jgi:hypothetical protein
MLLFVYVGGAIVGWRIRPAARPSGVAVARLWSPLQAARRVSAPSVGSACSRWRTGAKTSLSASRRASARSGVKGEHLRLPRRGVRHADLNHISPLGWSELTVDGRGNAYVNTVNFDFADFNDVLTSGKTSGKIALVAPDGEAREVADGLAFPNGMVVTPDNRTLIVAESFAGRLTAFDIDEDGSLSNRRTWADGIAPDGICLDADGCIWASSAHDANDCARVREGGEVLERIQLDRSCFASMLGGPAARCSCSPPTGVAPRTSTTSSLRGRARSSSPTRQHPESAGRKPTALEGRSDQTGARDARQPDG